MVKFQNLGRWGLMRFDMKWCLKHLGVKMSFLAEMIQEGPA